MVILLGTGFVGNLAGPILLMSPLEFFNNRDDKTSQNSQKLIINLIKTIYSSELAISIFDENGKQFVQKV